MFVCSRSVVTELYRLVDDEDLPRAVVYGKFAVGMWVLGVADMENRWLALVVGLVGFALIGLIPVIGGLAEFIVFLLGLGALALSLRELYRTNEATEATPSP